VEIKIVQLGPRLPMSTRRIVSFVGESQEFKTRIGLIMGLADGAVVVCDTDDNGYVDADGWSVELSPDEARRIAQRLMSAAAGVDDWARRAKGYYRIDAKRDHSGTYVCNRDETHLMRLSKLRGSRRYGRNTATCSHCNKVSDLMWVSTTVRREQFVSVCEVCLEALIEQPCTFANVVSLGK
jgi:hypothetical protein